MARNLTAVTELQGAAADHPTRVGDPDGKGFEMEEITLAVPNTFSDSPGASAPSGTGPGGAPGELERMARAFLAAARSRDRLALTERTRRRRQENFELQLKRLVKTVASETAGTVPDRRARADVRTRIYAAMTVVVRLAAQDQRRTARRARLVLRWAMASAGVGAAGTLFTLKSNGWL